MRRLIPITRRVGSFCCCHASRFPSPTDPSELFPVTVHGTVVADGSRGNWEAKLRFEDGRWVARIETPSHPDGEDLDCFLFMDHAEALEVLERDDITQGRARELYMFIRRIIAQHNDEQSTAIDLVDTEPRTVPNGVHPERDEGPDPIPF